MTNYRCSKTGQLSNCPQQVELADSGQLDAFGRLRVSQPNRLFDSVFKYDTQTQTGIPGAAGSVAGPAWVQSTTGTGTVSHLPNQQAVQMTVGAGVGTVIRQSKLYSAYLPGKSQFIIATGIMPVPEVNLTSQIGYFDDQNGLFFQLDITGLAVVQRSFTSGAAVDTIVYQPDWNVDRLDGSGDPFYNPSGILLDITKSQIFVIDLQWLGVGRTRLGFDINGLLHIVHVFNNANSITVPYMTTAKLPVRYAISATGAIAAPTSMIQICSCIVEEGGDLKPSQIFTLDTGFTSTTTPVINKLTPILSIKLNPANIRATLSVINYEIFTSDNSFNYRYALILNPVFSVAPVFSTPAGLSAFCYAQSAFGLAGTSRGDFAPGTLYTGLVVDSGYVYAANASASKSVSLSTDGLLNSIFSINSDIAGNSDIMTIAIQPQSAAAATVFASITFAQFT